MVASQLNRKVQDLESKTEIKVKSKGRVVRRSEHGKVSQLMLL
jgi:hypothetical protein